MIKNNKLIVGIAVLFSFFVASCDKEDYSFGEIKTPSALVLNVGLVGSSAVNINGDGSGNVDIVVSATDAVSYKINFGDGDSAIAPGGKITHKYGTPGILDYTITVNAIGTGGALSTISKKVTVLVVFEIPAAMMTAITGNSSKVWVSDRKAGGHFGVGQTDLFIPNYYSASPDQREDCAYDDEVTFTKTTTGQIAMTINNKGTSQAIGAATAFYGFSGGDGCYGIPPANNATLVFSGATSSSTSANSTRIQFKVPGKGNIIFGTGGSTYEILNFTNTTMEVRNIGIDGLAWYQKFKQK